MATLLETITSPRHRFEIHENNGREYVIKFKLRGKKGRLYNWWGESLRDCINKEVEYEKKEAQEWENRFAQNKIDRTELFESLKVGDIIQCKWGATIDAVKFFTLTEKKGKSTVFLQEIGETKNARDCMVGSAVANPEIIKGSPFKVTFNKFDGKTFKIKDLPYSHCKKWGWSIN